MPNARDATNTAAHRILALGDTGAGKTTQILTLPGKKYAYLFDPGARRSLQGHDIDYDEFLPTAIPAGAVSLANKAGGDKRPAASVVYQEFENQFDERIRDGFFDQYDWICFDSATTLLDLMMDRILTINGRFGQWPHEDDWGPQMVAFTNLVRTVLGMNKNIYFTGHMQDRRDRVTKGMQRRLMMTGQLVQKIPLLFTDVLGFDSDVDNKGTVAYLLYTVRNAEFPVIRSSMRGLDPTEPVTIDWTQPVEGQGLGGIINWASKQK